VSQGDDVFEGSNYNAASQRNVRNVSLPGLNPKRSILMQNGSAIMNQKYAGQPGYPKKVNKIQNDFLRRGNGRGGSPT
jgi:hypothetical protein|tara:strand:- start:222 stop:455 length:234 start_codon:yes stop_codon:yes gene_type:complete